MEDEREKFGYTFFAGGVEIEPLKEVVHGLGQGGASAAWMGGLGVPELGDGVRINLWVRAFWWCLQL